MAVFKITPTIRVFSSKVGDGAGAAQPRHITLNVRSIVPSIAFGATDINS